MQRSELQLKYNLSTHSIIRENGEPVATFSNDVSTVEAFNIVDALQPNEFERLYEKAKDELEYERGEIDGLKAEIKELQNKLKQCDC